MQDCRLVFMQAMAIYVHLVTLFEHVHLEKAILIENISCSSWRKWNMSSLCCVWAGGEFE